MPGSAEMLCPMRRRRSALVGLLAAALTGCTASMNDRESAPTASESGPPKRFTIAPDDYHVPFAGTAEDGRKFFLSDELFSFGTPDTQGTGFVGLYLWNADGSFSEVRVDPVPRRSDVPPGQAASAGADELIEKRLAELGDYKREPITVEPFLTTVDGVKFGWAVSEYEGSYSINIEPGDFIAYNEPFDGLEYDT